MADDIRDEKEEQMEVFEDILESQYRLVRDFYDKVIKHCERAIKIISNHY